ELAERLASIPGQKAKAAVLLGALRSSMSDPGGAAEAFAQALRLDPKLRGLTPPPAEVSKLLARELLRVGRSIDARAPLRPVLSAGQDHEASWLLSRAWLQEGRLEEARAALGEARGYGADDPTAFEPAPYVGAARCGECHAANYQAQQSSRHSRTFAA